MRAEQQRAELVEERLEALGEGAGVVPGGEAGRQRVRAQAGGRAGGDGAAQRAQHQVGGRAQRRAEVT